MSLSSSSSSSARPTTTTRRVIHYCQSHSYGHHYPTNGSSSRRRIPARRKSSMTTKPYRRAVVPLTTTEKTMTNKNISHHNGTKTMTMMTSSIRLTALPLLLLLLLLFSATTTTVLSQEQQQQRRLLRRGDGDDGSSSSLSSSSSRELFGRQFSRYNNDNDNNNNKNNMLGQRNNQWNHHDGPLLGGRTGGLLQNFDYDYARDHGDVTYNSGQSPVLIGHPVDVSSFVVGDDDDEEEADAPSRLLNKNPLAHSSSSSSSLPQTRIVGGQEAMLEPFVMHLMYDEDSPPDEKWRFHGCGGTLISNCHVLTAAHCVDRSVQTDGLYIGAYKPFDDGNGGARRHFSYISDIIANAGFTDGNNANDVAILTLSECTSGHEIIDIADTSFMSSNLRRGDNLTVAGFGQLGSNDDTPVEILRSVDVGYIPRSDCNTYYPNQVLDDMLCAGFIEQGGSDSCQGDSGGPLWHTDPITGIKTQVGIVSWGIGCAQPYRPGVYTQTAYHFDYIKDIVCNYPMTDRSINLCSGMTQTTNNNSNPGVGNGGNNNNNGGGGGGSNNNNNGGGGVQQQQQCTAVGGLCGEEGNMPCCQSGDEPLECTRIRGVFQCAPPSRPKRESMGKNNGHGSRDRLLQS